MAETQNEASQWQALLGVYLDLLDETTEQVRGYYLDRNTSLMETLATVSAEVASQPVSQRCASLAAQVEHTRFYLDVTIDAMLGQNVEGQDWDLIWRTVREVTPEEWAASQARLRASCQRLRALVSHPEEWGAQSAFGDALAALVHTAFHLGQIRQALCTLMP